LSFERFAEGIAEGVGDLLSERYSKRSEVEQLRQAHRRSRRYRTATFKAVQGELAALRGEVEYLSLVLTSLIAHIDANGVVSREDLRSLMFTADHFDGVVDGRLPVAVLDELLRGDQGETDVADETPGDSPAEPTLQ
jgi:hypothetical protein